MNALVVAAHPDDEVLGCGGTIARLADEGHRVHVVICAEGATGRYRKPEEADPELVRALQAQSREATSRLGAAEISFLELPDQRLETVPLVELVLALEELIGRIRPEAVYTHQGGDLNVDHTVVHRATLTATRPIPGGCVRDVYAFAVASSTEWAFGQLGPPFEPNVFVDVTATLERKLAAVALYREEARAFPHPRSPEMLRAAALRWGAVAGVAAAEPFVLVRSLR